MVREALARIRHALENNRLDAPDVPDVGEWIGREQQQVGPLPWLDRAELAINADERGAVPSSGDDVGPVRDEVARLRARLVGRLQRPAVTASPSPSGVNDRPAA